MRWDRSTRTSRAVGPAIGLTSAVLAVSHVVVLAGAALVLAGTGWIIALGSLNASFQSTLPSWVKARGTAYSLIAFQGGSGIGALVLGAVTQATSLRTGLFVVTAGLVVGAVVTWRRPSAAFPSANRRDRLAPVGRWLLADAVRVSTGTFAVIDAYLTNLVEILDDGATGCYSPRHDLACVSRALDRGAHARSALGAAMLLTTHVV